MMSDEQRDALIEHDLTLVSTLMGERDGEYILLVREPVDGERRLVAFDGTVHPYVDGRAARTTRVSAADLPAA